MNTDLSLNTILPVGRMVDAQYAHGRLDLQEALPLKDGTVVRVMVLPQRSVAATENIRQQHITLPLRQGRVLTSLHRRDIYDDVG